MKVTLSTLINAIASPSQTVFVKQQISEIKTGLESGSIKGIHLKPNGGSFWASLFKNDKNNSEQKKDNNIYFEIPEFLTLLSRYPEYHDELDALCDILTTDHISEKELSFFITILIQQLNDQKLIIKFLELYQKLNYSLKELLFKQSYTSNILQSALSSKHIQIIDWLCLQIDFESSLDKLDILAHLESKEQFFCLVEKNINFSNINELYFIKIKEEILIEYLKKYPEKLSELYNKNIEYYDEDAHCWIKCNIFEYAVLKKYYMFLNYLISNKTNHTNFSVSSHFFSSCQAVESVKQANLDIIEPYENVYYLEVLLQDSYFYGKISLNKNFLETAIKENLPNIINYFLSENSISLITFDIIALMLLEFTKRNQFDLLEKTHILINKINTNNDFDPIIYQVFNTSIACPGNQKMLCRLLKYHSDKLKFWHDDPIIKETICYIQNPRIAFLLIENGFDIPKEKLKEMAIMAHVQGEIETRNTLLTHYGAPIPQIIQWPYEGKCLHTTESDQQTNLANQKYYGTGISQVEYKIYHEEIINIILANMINGSFKLIPQKYFDNEEHWWCIADEAEVGKLINNHMGKCDIFRLGVMRQWIAAVSNPLNSMLFGLYRHDDVGSVFTTPYSSKYQLYFDKFLQEKLSKFRDTKYLKIDEFGFYNKSIVAPDCTIIGFIDDQPIELTKYGYCENSRIHYGWLHVNSNDIPKLLVHCQKLIDNILKININLESQLDISLLSQKIGQLHWWLAHTCYYQRGSASITETICGALFKYHGLLVEWKQLPDCEALISPSEEEYAKNYLSLTKLTLLSKPAELNSDFDASSMQQYRSFSRTFSN